MSWQLPITPQHSAAPLTPEQLAAGMEPQPDQRPWLTGRIAACRSCEHVASGGQSCTACDIRCTHPSAAKRPPLLAVSTSTCPLDLWPVTS